MGTGSRDPVRYRYHVKNCLSPCLLFLQQRRKRQAIKPGGNLIKSDKRKQFHVFKQELSWRGSWPQDMPKDVDLAGIRRGLDL